MKKQKIDLKKLIFIGLISLLFFPMFQQHFNLIKLDELKGSFTKTDNPTLSKSSWFSGEYQKKSEKHLNDALGFRSFFVRLYNQIHYSFYNEPKANSVLVGKDNFLYEEGYIKAYYGTDFIGDSAIQDKVLKLKKIQDTLKAHNIELVIVFAPGKATFYPEKIPAPYDTSKVGKTNYEVYTKELQKHQLNFIDFNKWFLALKDTSQYPLIPKTGIHWSVYGEFLAADSLISYLNAQYPNRKLPFLRLNSIETSTKILNSDDDIEKGMNLLFNISDLSMVYPSFDVVDTLVKKEDKISPIVISDSFYWGMFNWGISSRVFEDGKFWYYNEAIYPDSYEKSLKVKNIDLHGEVLKRNVIVLMATDANLYKFPFGFVDHAYTTYFDTSKEEQIKLAKERRSKHFIKAIEGTEEWMELVKEEAKRENKTVKEKVLAHAKYMVWKEEQTR